MEEITGIIIQARTGSTRLPNKVLLRLQGKSVLERVVQRVRESRKIDKVVIATTTQKKDDRIVNICKKLNIDYFRGSENDVLDRYYQAVKLFGVDSIVRITADCPMIDPDIIDKVIDLYKKEKLDYASNVIPPTFPDGLDVEVFSQKALKKSWKEAKLKSEREHVTVYMWRNPRLFKQNHLKNKVNLSDRRWVLDGPKDYEFMKRVYDKLYLNNHNFRMNDLLKFFMKNPEIEKINKGTKRNEGLKRSLKEDKIL